MIVFLVFLILFCITMTIITSNNKFQQKRLEQIEKLKTNTIQKNSTRDQNNSKYVNKNSIDMMSFDELSKMFKYNMEQVNQELISLENDKQNPKEIDLSIEKTKERISRKSILEDYDFTKEEILEAKAKLKSPYTDRDRIWYILNNRQMNFFAQKEWEEFCDTQEDMASFLCEDKKYKQALEHYLNSFIVYHSGFFNKDEVWSIADTISLGTQPLLIENIKSTMKFGNLKNEDLKLIIYNNKYYQLLPFNYYTIENLYNILLDLFENNLTKIREYPYNKPNKNSNLYRVLKYYVYKNFICSLVNGQKMLYSN